MLTSAVILILGSLSNSFFQRRTSTGSGLFASLGSGLVETLGKIVLIREKKLSNTTLLASTHMKREKVSLLLEVRRSKTSLLKLPITSLRLPGLSSPLPVLSLYADDTSAVSCSDSATRSSRFMAVSNKAVVPSLVLVNVRVFGWVRGVAI